LARHGGLDCCEGAVGLGHRRFFLLLGVACAVRHSLSTGR
jgi:hypothetical protein